MKIKYKYLIVSFILITFTSCGLFRTGVLEEKGEDIESLRIDNEEYNDNVRIDKDALIVIDSLKEKSIFFETFSASFTGKYENNDQNIPLKGMIRIKKDQFIWISLRPALSIEIGRLLITQDSIKYLDRMKNEYLAESYSYIQKNFGLEMNYNIIESAVTNKFFAYPPGNTKEAYFLIQNESQKANTLSATGIFFNFNLSHNIVFSDKSYNIIENNLKLLDKNKKVRFLYSEFKDIYGIKFHHNILINIFDNSKISSIDIKYSSIVRNKEFELNFKIPENYKRKHFE